MTPDWGLPRVSGNGTSMYCHTAATSSETQEMSKAKGVNNPTSAEVVGAMVHRCALTNWLEYFNLAPPSVEPRSTGSVRVIEVGEQRGQLSYGALLAL